MLHGFARLAFFAERTAKPLWDYRIGNRESGIGNWESGIGNRELVSCQAFLKHFSRRLSINLEPSPLGRSPHLPFVTAASGLKKEHLL